MKIKPLALALSSALVVVPSLAAAQAQTQAYPLMSQQVAPGTTPVGAEQWVSRMTDFTQNGSAFRDPEQFAAWMNAMTDPSMVTAMGTQMMEPGNMLRSMTTMMQPGTAANYMQFMDPAMYMRWSSAMMNPMWYTRMATSMADPGKMMRWAMLPMDPKMMGMGAKMMDPNRAVTWMMTPTDPRAMSLMFAPMNPQLYGSMLGGVVNTKNVGGNWGTFLNPATPVVQVQPPAPVSSPINVYDPSTWFSMMNMFGGMPAMPSMPAMSMPFTTAGNTYAAAPADATAQPAAAETLSLGGDALFKIGKSSVKDLTAAGRTELDGLVARLKAFSAIDSIKVTGHADKTGKPAANQRLSLARAKAVAAYLKSKGIRAASFTTAGMGDTQPVVECDMKQAKAALTACLAPNRRVEIEVKGAVK